MLSNLHGADGGASVYSLRPFFLLGVFGLSFNPLFGYFFLYFSLSSLQTQYLKNSIRTLLRTPESYSQVQKPSYRIINNSHRFYQYQDRL